MRLFPNKTLGFQVRILLLSLLVQQGLMAQVDIRRSAIATKEIERRQLLVQEAQVLLEQGDNFYRSGNFEKSVAAYGAALDSVPNSPVTEDLRASLAQRYGQSSIEFAKGLSRKGDTAGARAVLEQAMKLGELADNAELIAAKNEILDPIRANPALTSEHAKKVDEVRRLLYLADGAFDLGKFDDSKSFYEDVIRLDPTNTAARRGMEKVAATKSKYYGTAYDQHRAKVLAEIASAWELPVAPTDVIPEFDSFVGSQLPNSFIPVANKLSRIVIPKFVLQEATLMEAVELLRLRAAEFDDLAVDPAQKGFNITINVGDPSDPETEKVLAKTFDLNLSNVPVETVLKYVTSLTGTSFRPDDYAVTITRLGAAGEGLVTDTYRVPPDFLSSLASESQSAPDSGDIFNTEPSGGGLLVQRMGAQEAFEQQGISFQDGASAFLNPTTNTLRVVNTARNQDIIRQIIDNITQTEPVTVAVRVTMLKVQKSVLEELSFDWLLNPFEFGYEGPGSGNRVLNLSGGTIGSGTPLGNVPSGGVLPSPSNPITGGNRSGGFATSPFSLDTFLDSGSNRDTQNFERAPGILGLNGILGNAAVQTLMRGLDQRGGTDLLAQPSVTTRSGQSASINLSEEFIYPTEYEPPEVPVVNVGGGGGVTPITPANPTAFDTRDIGVQLEVLPVADANRQYIDVTINPSITDFEGFVNYGSPIQTVLGTTVTVLTENAILMPVFSVSQVNANVTVTDGATMVIGGLLKDEVINVNDKAPFLGDLPLLGRFFQSNASRHTSTAILFLVNVELLDPTGRPFRNR